MNNKLGRHISELRKKKNLTQKELSEVVYVSDKAISKWETGKSFPDLPILSLLAEALDVSVIDLLEVRKNKNESTATEIIESIFNRNKKKTTYRLTIAFVALLTTITIIACSALFKEKNQPSYVYPLIDSPIVACGVNYYEGHTGVDYTNESLRNGNSTEVYAVTDGVIKDFGYSDTKGYWIIIETKGYSFMYSFLDNTGDVYVGQEVVAGEVLLVRSAAIIGLSTGAFVELVIIEDITTFNPHRT